MNSRSNTRTSRFVQNTVFTAAYQLTAMLMGFVTPRLMMLFYGSQVNGLIVSATEFLTYFRLVEAGLAALGGLGALEEIAVRIARRQQDPYALGEKLANELQRSRT